MRIALTGSAYQARSIIASAQRQVNLFAEKNPPGTIIDAGQQAGSITTLYPAPGLLPLASPPAAGAGRGLYWASSDTLFYVCGATLYQVTPNWTLTALGTIAPGTTPVSMADNGLTMGLFDGSANGYQVDLTTLAFSAINGAPTPAGNAPTVASTFVYGFYGSDRAAMLDGYLILNQPGTRNFYCTYNGEFVFDSLYIAAKNGFSDNLVAAVVNQRSLWLIGERTTEIWSDVGGATFPFAILPGPFVQQGCVAKYSHRPDRRSHPLALAGPDRNQCPASHPGLQRGAGFNSCHRSRVGELCRRRRCGRLHVPAGRASVLPDQLSDR